MQNMQMVRNIDIHNDEANLEVESINLSPRTNPADDCPEALDLLDAGTEGQYCPKFHPA